MAGVDEALMLDPHGFVATCNSVNFFCVRRGEVRTVCVWRGLFLNPSHPFPRLLMPDQAYQYALGMHTLVCNFTAHHAQWRLLYPLPLVLMLD